MKLHCHNILLFALPLNIFVSLSSYVHNNKNKIYITSHHIPTTTSRVLSECDTESSIYDKDEDMESVKENFERQTSQRFEEYQERMKEKRQKRKEQRDKNIQKIIQKDKMDKSLAEKIEKGCLKCGCGLGGVAASVGLFGGLGTYGWKTSAIAMAAKEAGAEAGVKALIHKLKEAFPIPNFFDRSLEKAITPKTYCNADLISEAVKQRYELLCETGSSCEEHLLLQSYKSMPEAQRTQRLVQNTKTIVGEAVEKASDVTTNFTANEMASLDAGELTKITTTSSYAYSAIGYSVLAILIIVLVMIIIYLVLRYRRKKKMNKKAQYTKLLNQ
ncbi:rifin PIR protein, putative [Plasmodium reichenowi]|uniref:Rifin PIR protein, putative n=1 Tax=Plasmodium reichenowi TaxID=5854 RepID=A0A2P9DCC9_PLARE|nr:rifin PIR protein, putative [Plasmodium reichenowi]